MKKDLANVNWNSIPDLVAKHPGTRANVWYRYCRTGQLAYTVVGRRYFVNDEDLSRFLNSRYSGVKK